MKKFIKLILFLIIFAILHFSFDIFGGNFLKIFSGTDESVFSHLKMAFWAYFVVFLIDLAYCKNRKKDFQIYSALLINILMPWIIVIIWYIIPALYGKIHSEFYEILWAFFVLILTGLISFSIEKDLSKTNFSRLTNLIILFLFIISVFFYTYFTFSKPWVDIFQIP